MQKYYFLTGLSRAGNTLFGSIMNQNPDISVTGNSITTEILWRIERIKNQEQYVNFPDEKSINNVLENLLPNYYSGWNYKYIIDRSTWSMQGNIKLIEKYLKNDIKMIVLVRDVIEVLASFVKFSNENSNYHLNRVGKTPLDKCDYLMRYDGLDDIGQVYGSLSGIKNLIENKEYKKYYKFVEYNDLVKKPQQTIDDVYEFLNIPKFKHKFENISQFKANGLSYNDEVLGGNLHTIKTNKVKKNEYNVNDILPQTVINKYSGLNIWRNET